VKSRIKILLQFCINVFSATLHASSSTFLFVLERGQCLLANSGLLESRFNWRPVRGGRTRLIVYVVTFTYLSYFGALLTQLSRLDKFWQILDIIYEFKTQLEGTGSRSGIQ